MDVGRRKGQKEWARFIQWRAKVNHIILTNLSDCQPIDRGTVGVSQHHIMELYLVK